MVYFYLRQWCFDKAENWQKYYIHFLNDDLNKLQAYRVLSYILKKEKKYSEAKRYLDKAKVLNEKNNLKFKFNLDEEFLLLMIEMNEKKQLNDFYEKIEETKDNENNYNYYNILKDIQNNNYNLAKNKIEQEMVHTEHRSMLFNVLVPSKYSHIIANEIYRNSLRKLLLKIFTEKNNKTAMKKILTDITISEEGIYGYYSPENLCNNYYIYNLDETQSTKEKMQKIASKLLFFKNVNKKD